MNKENLNESFGTLSETINGLLKLGYSYDFNTKDDTVVGHRSQITLSPGEYKIDNVYRFEGESDPEYQSILYAISSVKFDVKGTLVNGYGISSDEEASKLIEALETHADQDETDYTSNDSTPKRPSGDRVLNAPLVEININEFIHQIKSETTWAESDRNSVTIFKSENMRIVLLGLHENAELKTHKANGVISVQVMEGRIEFSADNQRVQIEKGQMVALQENILHNVKALTESFFLLTLVMNNR